MSRKPRGTTVGVHGGPLDPGLLGAGEDDPRPAKGSLESPVDIFWVPARLRQSLERLAHQESVTKEVVVAAALASVLHRYDPDEEIVIELVDDGNERSSASTRFFFSEHPTFRELVRTATARPSGDGNPGNRDPAAIDERGSSSARRIGLGFCSHFPSNPVLAGFDLALWIVEREGGLNGLFAASEWSGPVGLWRIQGHFLTLLSGVSATPDERAAVLPILTPDEWRRISVEWNETARKPVSEANVAQLFDAHARTVPDTVAVTFGDRHVTYGELIDRSDCLARALQSAGVTPRSNVGICMKRSIELPIAVLAVLKAGAAYVALDPDYPTERIEYILEDSGASLVVVDAETESRIRSGGARPFMLDPKTLAALASREGGPLSAALSEDIAYVIYTSGSTGKPKGVSMPHRALVNLISWQREASPTPAAKTLQFASLNFDVSFQEIFSTWCAGGTLVLISEAVRRDAQALWRLLSDESVERLFLPFVALQHLAEAADSGHFEAPNLREVITAGEQLQITPQIVRMFAGRTPRVLQNHYGPSETHVVTSFTLSGDPARWPALPPIGRPIGNTRIYLLDGNGQPVPVGLPGELHVAGAPVARGYWNRPDLTREKFLPDPFGNDPNGRLYKTGDLARYREDGQIEFLGRLDEQVKIRGYRVEPGEISAVLAGHPDLRETVVVANDDEEGVKFLVAYFVAHAGRVPATSELRSFLKEHLPEFMIPSVFVPMDKFPLTPSGKVDRRALPPPSRVRAELERPFVAPRNPTEARIASMWRKILRLEQVGIRDDFFELGGNSISAGRLAIEIQKQFGKSVSPTALLLSPTIEELAKLLGFGEQDPRWTSLVPIQPGGALPPLFCMHASAGTVFFYKDLVAELGPDRPIYGLQAQGIYGVQPPHRSVDEMAKHYASEIRTVQPFGPYFLAGFCFGGLLAVAVAQEFVRSGQKVGLVASFDGPGPWRFLQEEEGPIASTSRRTRYVRGLAFREKTAYLARGLRARLGMWKNGLMMWIAEIYRGKNKPLPLSMRETYFRANSNRARAEYAPLLYPGRIVVFRTRGYLNDPHLLWDEWVEGGVEGHEVPPSPLVVYHPAFIRAIGPTFKEILERRQPLKPISAT